MHKTKTEMENWKIKVILCKSITKQIPGEEQVK